MLSAVIPILNEEKTLKIVLANLEKIPFLNYAFFVLNGSTDQSLAIVKQAKTNYQKVILSYPTALGFDIPRAVGAFWACQISANNVANNSKKAILFLDGDTACDIHQNLKQLAQAVLLENVDLALANCYPYPHKRFALADEVLKSRGELNRTLGLFHDLGLASPSHGPICVSEQIISQIGVSYLAIPPLFMAKVREQQGKIKVATALANNKWYGAPRDDEHNQLIAETIIGDNKMAQNYYLTHTLNREGYPGYHPYRNFQFISQLTGEDMLPDF